MAKKLSVGASEVLEILKENGGKMTFAQVRELYPKANPSHLGALVRAGVVSSGRAMVKEVIEREVEKTVYQILPKTEKGDLAFFLFSYESVFMKAFSL